MTKSTSLGGFPSPRSKQERKIKKMKEKNNTEERKKKKRMNGFLQRPVTGWVTSRQMLLWETHVRKKPETSSYQRE